MSDENINKLKELPNQCIHFIQILFHLLLEIHLYSPLQYVILGYIGIEDLLRWYVNMIKR